MDFEQARFNMVEQQIRPWDVLDLEVLDTVMAVKRELFVPEASHNLAFSDIQVPLLNGQVMLEPKIEAKVLQALALRKTDQVLEIGTGSGYMAALLAAHSEWVRTIERDHALAAFATANLHRADVQNVIVEEGDGANGWPTRAPYDAIVISGGLYEVPRAILEQLKPEGRLIAFVGAAPVMTCELTTCVAEGRFETVKLFETLVPMLHAPAPERFVF
ncbi:MAG: protein-L-isoaspartate O-methyltransferase [Betaproteobacteria bacterium]|nr:protein-L-isoaspartate O-methyltransferase [Betaproteobacteria bacterium]